MKFIKNMFKKEKRQVNYWYPLAVTTAEKLPGARSGNLSQLKRAMGMYHSVLMSCPIVARDTNGEEIDHPLLRVIENPTSWLNKSEFFTLLIQDYFLSGNFFCFIKEDNAGNVTGLLPYPSEAVFCYPQTDSARGVVTDSSDPVRLEQYGYYYQTSFSDGKDKDGKERMIVSKVSANSIWHLKNLWNSTSDTLNGRSIFSQFPETLSFATAVLELADRYAESGGLGPTVISGIPSESSEEIEQQQKVIEDFFRQRGQFLTLPPEVKLSELGKSMTPEMLQALSSISSLSLARVMQCPIQLIEREDSLHSSGGGQNLKETFRFFLRTSAKSFLNGIENKLNELVSDSNVKIEFNFRSLMASDLRENAQSLSALIQTGAVTKEEVRDWLRI